MRLNSKKNQRIGVLGGIGPEASAYYYSLLIQRMQSRGLAQTKPIPEIVIFNLSVKEMTQDKSSQEDLEPYVIGIAQLNKLNVDFIVMVCNTIHLYIDLLQRGSKAPILNLIEATGLTLNQDDVEKRILTLGTQQTIKSNLFKVNRGSQIKLSPDEIELLSNTIENFNRGIQKNIQREKVLSLIRSKNLSSNDLLVLGCTEFAVMLKDDDILNKIDTVSILVNLTIDNLTK